MIRTLRFSTLLVTLLLFVFAACGGATEPVLAIVPSDASVPDVDADAGPIATTMPIECTSTMFKSDSDCMPCSTACASGSYQTTPCSATADRTCASCTVITNCASLSCTGDGDSTCTSCTAPFILRSNRCEAPLTQQAYIKAANADSGDELGTSVGMSGDFAVVGAPYESSNQTTITNGDTASADDSADYSGAAYVYMRTGRNWSAHAYIKAANAEADDDYGVSVAISGDTIVVGADAESSNQTTITNGAGASTDNTAPLAGAAYVYTRTGNMWTQQAFLKASNAEMLDYFGGAVAISGDTIVVGAVGEDSNQDTITNGSTASTNNGASFSGAAYVFARTGTTWTQQAYLKASNGGTRDRFGTSVAISGDTILVGAPEAASDSGIVYVFKRTGTTWTEQAVLTASNADVNDAFGFSIGISGDTAVVGALNEQSNQRTITNGPTASTNNTAGASGAAYVFVRTGDSWAQQAYLKASNADGNDRFGTAVGISGHVIVVGAPEEESMQTTIVNGPTASFDNTAGGSGAAYLFSRTGTTWEQRAYIKASNAGSGDHLANAVAIDGTTLFVAASSEGSNQSTITNGATASANNLAPSSGACYVFDR